MKGHVERLYVLRVGSIQNDLSWNLAGINAAITEEPTRPAEWIEVPSLAYLIKHFSAGWILFDSGFRLDDFRRLPNLAQRRFPVRLWPGEGLGDHLAKLELEPREISRIVISHRHWAAVMVGEKDFAFGLTATHQRSGEPFGGGGYFWDSFERRGVSFELVPPDAGVCSSRDTRRKCSVFWSSCRKKDRSSFLLTRFT